MRQFHLHIHSRHHCNYGAHKVFSVFTCRCLITTCNSGPSPSSGFPNSPLPQPPASHFSQLQLSLFPNSDCLFACRISLDCVESQGQGYVTKDGLPAGLVGISHLWPKIRFVLLSDSVGIDNMGRPYWREDGSAGYNCSWYSSAQSLSSSGPVVLVTTVYSLRFQIHQPGGSGPRI
jgi:hypothetical protein